MQLSEIKHTHLNFFLRYKSFRLMKSGKQSTKINGGPLVNEMKGQIYKNFKTSYQKHRANIIYSKPMRKVYGCLV